ncbi:ATP-binding cassette domain-containing protein [Cellulomonas oligotrophica]|uniref:ABC-type glutathione transport system ATPase component n=1 Tax=Cellulomonas oligotrophica TaxID=931536 RepID=A0A7Y9FEP0_9CELL|nr:ATP-binding cassette domain-containing protein [Cellulomonas oligotrophica]NYD85943.1 ABC-type glutathione transport system ATPase component [Cellulomonas oligotrophica]GIG31049.1 peptide ABC transporter ATP-binding protein [Cellulomonas oligotrophica]
MSSTPAVLQATDVWAGYGGPPVLAGVDLTLRPGDAVGLVGRSGVGKSTLVEVLGGGLRPGRGHVTFAGIPVGRTPMRHRKAVRARLRTVHQNGLAGIDPDRSVEQTMNDAFGEARKAGRSTNHDVEAALGVVGLPVRFVTRRVGSLSGGERQRVAIARALAARPDLLLLDEPLTAVDAGMRDEVVADIRALVHAEGIGLLVASHDLRLLDRLTTHVHVLADGTLIESGPLRDVLRDPQHAHTRELADALPDAVAGSRALDA